LLISSEPAALRRSSGFRIDGRSASLPCDSAAAACGAGGAAFPVRGSPSACATGSSRSFVLSRLNVGYNFAAARVAGLFLVLCFFGF